MLTPNISLINQFMLEIQFCKSVHSYYIYNDIFVLNNKLVPFPAFKNSMT